MGAVEELAVFAYPKAFPDKVEMEKGHAHEEGEKHSNQRAGASLERQPTANTSSTFRSRTTLWEEGVNADTGILGLSTNHVYFAGNRKKFRVRYDRIVSFDPWTTGSG